MHCCSCISTLQAEIVITRLFVTLERGDQSQLLSFARSMIVGSPPIAMVRMVVTPCGKVMNMYVLK